MMNQTISNEIKSLEEVTNKCCGALNNYYHKCYQKLSFKNEYSTQFEFNEAEERANDIILSFLRDYALFDEDNSDLLRSIDLDDYQLFNCCGPDRLGGGRKDGV